jgi:hypothetical protein
VKISENSPLLCREKGLDSNNKYNKRGYIE